MLTFRLIVVRSVAVFTSITDTVPLPSFAVYRVGPTGPATAFATTFVYAMPRGSGAPVTPAGVDERHAAEHRVRVAVDQRHAIGKRLRDVDLARRTRVRATVVGTVGVGHDAPGVEQARRPVEVVVGVDVGPTGVAVRVGVGVQKNTPGGGGAVGATIGGRTAVTPGVGSTTVGVRVFVGVGVLAGVTVPVAVGVGVSVKGVRVAVDVTVKVAVAAATTTAGTGVMHGRPNGRNGGFPPAPGPCTLLVTVNTGGTLLAPRHPVSARRAR